MHDIVDPDAPAVSRPYVVLAVLCFSVFTFLAVFSTSVWALGIFRLLAGLGIGGEWSVDTGDAFGWFGLDEDHFY